MTVGEQEAVGLLTNLAIFEVRHMRTQWPARLAHKLEREALDRVYARFSGPGLPGLRRYMRDEILRRLEVCRDE